jgi:hypothetical protein
MANEDALRDGNGEATLLLKNGTDCDAWESDGAGAAKVMVKGSITSAPVTGAKTVSTVAASIFAGLAALASRKQMVVTNASAGSVYWGDENVETTTGMLLASGDTVVFDFDPSTATAIYFIADSDLEVRVGELA